MIVLSVADIRAALGVGVSATDAVLESCGSAAEGAILPHLRKKDSEGETIDYSTIAEVKEALVGAAIEIYRNRKSPTGTVNLPEMTQMPFGLGRYFLDRWSGLLGRWIDATGFIR